MSEASATPSDAEAAALADDQAHTEWARRHRGSGECAAFYINFGTGAPYQCSCGYADSLSAAAIADSSASATAD